MQRMMHFIPFQLLLTIFQHAQLLNEYRWDDIYFLYRKEGWQLSIHSPMCQKGGAHSNGSLLNYVLTCHWALQGVSGCLVGPTTLQSRLYSLLSTISPPATSLHHVKLASILQPPSSGQIITFSYVI